MLATLHRTANPVCTVYEVHEWVWRVAIVCVLFFFHNPFISLLLYGLINVVRFKQEPGRSK